LRNNNQAIVSRSTLSLLLAAVVAFLVVGCGSSQNDFVFTNTNIPVAPTTGNLTFNFVQAQGTITVPNGTTTLDFTFFSGPNQTGNTTLTDFGRDFAAQVTVVGVPTNTRSYLIVARNANGAALASTTGAVLVAPGQTTPVDVTGSVTVLTQPNNSPLNVFVSNNGASNAGDLDLFDQLLGFVRTFVSGNNQGIALDAVGTGYHNGDTDVNVLSRIAGRTGAFNNTLDRVINVSGATTIKGGAVLDAFGVAVLADFGGSQIVSLGLTGDGSAALGFSTTAAPWDVAYDTGGDRTFVAFTNGSIGVYDNASTNATGTPTRTFTATGLDNAHGISYDAATDILVVSDVGSVTTGPNTDGEIYVFSNASTATGTVVPKAVISGPNTQLGNPVDIDLANGDLRVAEKTNDQLLIFANILQSTGGDLVPALAVAETKPESLASQAPITLGPDNSDIDGGVTVQGLVVSTNSGANNEVIRMSPTFTGLDSFDTGFTNGESVRVDARGDVYMTRDTGMQVLGQLAKTIRDATPVSPFFDRFGGTVMSPKGLDVVESQGLVMVADAGDDTVRIFGKESDFANQVASITLPDANNNQSTWDLDYDPGNDRLFVTKDESVHVYDNFLAGNPGVGTVPDRTIVVTGAVFLHGIVYDAANDVLFLSDVGSVTMGPNTDGLLFVINNASTANGATAPDITIDNGTLGNPVDIAYDGTNLFVAEKTNDVVERYDNIRSSAGGNVAASASVAVTKPESISLVTGL
jgi:hypothetical protein